MHLLTSLNMIAASPAPSQVYSTLNVIGMELEALLNSLDRLLKEGMIGWMVADGYCFWTSAVYQNPPELVYAYALK